MGIKRKASFDSLPQRPIAFSNPFTFNPPTGGFVHEPSSSSPFTAPTSPFTADLPSTPALLPSRTRKRLRNNRPDDETVHQVTLRKLFTAQQAPDIQYEPATPLSLPDESEHMRDDEAEYPPLTTDAVTPRQKTLFSYFAPQVTTRPSLTTPAHHHNVVQPPPSPESMHLPSSPCLDLADRPRRTAFHQDRPKLDLGAANWQDSSCLSPTLVNDADVGSMLPTPGVGDGDVDMMEFEGPGQEQTQTLHPWLSSMFGEARREGAGEGRVLS